MKSSKKKMNHILFVIHPTRFGDYDVLAIGRAEDLKKIKEPSTWLTKKSQFGGVPIMVLDVCNTMTDARKITKDLQEKYRVKETVKPLRRDNARKIR